MKRASADQVMSRLRQFANSGRAPAASLHGSITRRLANGAEESAPPRGERGRSLQVTTNDGDGGDAGDDHHRSRS
jgi:hypothetical protein